MGFFDKIREFTTKIAEVENTIYGGKQEYLEIYERNLKLEREIAQYTNELSIANKRMFALQNILDMMNASKPLVSVLENITKSFQGELGYIHSVILRYAQDTDGEYMYTVANSGDDTIKRLNQLLPAPIDTFRLPYYPASIFGRCLDEKRILTTKNIRGMFKLILPMLKNNTISEAVSNMGSESFIVSPLFAQNKPFGFFCVFSSREELGEVEQDFLTMFTQQIEMAITIADLFEAVKSQAVTDSLTGLYNRRYFEETLFKEVSRSTRNNQPLSIIGLDLDYLKQINDNLGHSFGDAAIKTIAEVLKSNARTIDTPARIGGEEFNIILPGIDSKGAMIAAERIRKAIEKCKLDVIGNITASLGVATFLEHSNNIGEVLELVDQAMYQSKRDGRNRVTLAKHIAETSWEEVALNAFVDILSKHNIPVGKSTAKALSAKLKNYTDYKEMPKDILYSAADMLSKTYNPHYSKGNTKAKINMAVKLAKHFDLSKEEINNLRIAMLLYDIGNLMLPHELLLKKGALTKKEKEQIKTHPTIAVREILQPITSIQDVLPIIEFHHENWDGTGYPGKVSKEEIPMSSQIILIVDAYFALTEERNYRPKLAPKEALDIIKKEAGKKWNKILVSEFVALMEKQVTVSAA